MKLNFRQEVLTLPGAVLSQNADALQLRVLLWVASDLSLADKPRQLAKLADCSQEAVKAALAFWQSCGILTDEAEPAAVPAMAAVKEAVPAKPAAKPLQRADELPNYTSTELAELLEKRTTLRALVDEAQQIIGKVFNPSEINILVGMYDYLGLGEESILLLLAHCKKIGKIHLRSIEKYAYKLLDRGITTPAALEEEFCTVEALHSFEGEVRTLFGMKSRALTSREDKMLRAWVSFGYGIDIVRRAYEITVNATNEASLPYANSILESWNAEGLRTPEEIDRAIAARKTKKEAIADSKEKKTGSFDTDEFFEAALRRSFSESLFEDN